MSETISSLWKDGGGGHYSHEEPMYMEFLQKLLPNFKGGKVLEIGPGSGLFAEMLIESYDITDYTVLDLEKNIFHSVSRLINKKINLDYVFSQNYKDLFDRKFDILISNVVIPETPKEYREDLLNNVIPNCNSAFIIGQLIGPWAKGEEYKNWILNLFNSNFNNHHYELTPYKNCYALSGNQSMKKYNMNSEIKYKNTSIKFYNLLEKGHNIDKFIINNELYNRADHKFDHLLKHLKPNSVVYDIGAYIGTFSIPFAIEGMKVYAFEGFPDNYKRLNKNCEAYENIDVDLVALSNQNKTVNTKFNDCTAQTAQEREIKYVIFDEYLKNKKIEKPSLIKLDIEGMETLAFWGMTYLLENVQPIWQIGYHAGLDVKYEDYPGFVKPEEGGFNFNRFRELGYDIYNEQGQLVNKFTNFGEYICIPQTVNYDYT